jgi:predicted Fe-Mo cluster-binding NifX family protein
MSASAPGIDGAIDPRFGRCPYFLIVDTETMESEAVENPFVAASGGAGIQAAQLVASKGAKTVLTGSCGPNAFQTLTAAGVEVVTGASGPIRAAIESYVSGAGPRAAEGPNAPSHSGMGQGMGPSQGSGGAGQGMGQGTGRGTGRGTGGGMGQGMGRGMGRGTGKGMGQGMGRGMGMGTGQGGGQGRGGNQAGSSSPAPAADMDSLRAEARLLHEKLEQITSKIAELEKHTRKE